MLLRYIVVFVIYTTININVIAQNTVGLLSYDDEQSYDGYNLIYPHNQSTVYLFNNCGEVVHSWTDEDIYRPGNTCYILPNGNLIKTKRRFDATVNDPIWAGGGGAIVELRDWDNNLLGQYELNDSTARLHHDITSTDDGNILMIAWEEISESAAIDLGRDPALIANGKLWPEAILEWDPVLDEIVWEWHVTDHLIQDFDQTKPNFGVVADHPELININYDEHAGHQDWLHMNSIDYNAQLDQIIMSIPEHNELWVIDHSTTTEEAKSSAGGRSGKGGDLLYRWGNPIAYSRGTDQDKKLFFQHGVKWTNPEKGTPISEATKIHLFNNRVDDNLSRGQVIQPEFDVEANVYKLDEAGQFLPQDFESTFEHPSEPIIAASVSLSSAQLLPNGNMLLCAGRWGFSYELTPDNEVVWEYRVPIKMGARATQGDSLNISNNLTFRIQRYSPDFPAFTNRDLSAKGYIELEPNIEFCDMIVPTIEPTFVENLRIYPNPSTSVINISHGSSLDQVVRMLNISGQVISSSNIVNGLAKMDLSAIDNGLYFLHFENGHVEKILVQK